MRSQLIILWMCYTVLGKCEIPFQQRLSSHTKNTPFGQNQLATIASELKYIMPKDSMFSIGTDGDVQLTKELDVKTLCTEHQLCCDKSVNCSLTTHIDVEAVEDTASLDFKVYTNKRKDKIPIFSASIQKIPLSNTAVVGQKISFKSTSDGNFSLGDTNLIYELVIEILDKNHQKPNLIPRRFPIKSKEAESVEISVIVLNEKGRSSHQNTHKSSKSHKLSSNDPITSTFKLDKQRGRVVLLKPLGVKERNFNEFVTLFGVKDAQHISLNDKVNKRIEIEDVKNQIPTLKELAFTNEIAENKRLSNLLTFEVSDGNGKVKCTLLSPVDDMRLIWVPPIYNLHLLRTYDAEVNSTVAILIKCYDQENPSKSNQQIWNVKILDVNEFMTEMKSNIYEVVLKENSETGTYVTQVIAEDKDRDAKIKFTMDAFGSQYFNIDPYNGILTCKGGEVGSSSRLDREIASRIEFLVYAIDENIENGNQVNTTIIVNFSDVSIADAEMNAKIKLYFIVAVIVITSVILIYLIAAIICACKCPKKTSGCRNEFKENEANSNIYCSPRNHCNGRLDRDIKYKNDSVFTMESLKVAKCTQYHDNSDSYQSYAVNNNQNLNPAICENDIIRTTGSFGQVYDRKYDSKLTV